MSAMLVVLALIVLAVVPRGWRLPLAVGLVWLLWRRHKRRQFERGRDAFYRGEYRPRP